MKIIVIYKSRTGFTKRYAQWIADELMCETANYADIHNLDLSAYDLVIYGGRVHAGIIDGLRKMRRLLENKPCRLVVFATGATPFAAAEDIEQTMQNNFGDSGIPHFYMQSGLCYEKMGLADKTIMKLFARMLAGKKEQSEAEKIMAAAIVKSYDISDKQYILPLVAYVKETYGKNS